MINNYYKKIVRSVKSVAVGIGILLPQRWVEYLNTKTFATSCVTTSPYTLSVVRISECRMSFCCTGNRSSRGLQLATAPSQWQRLYPASSAPERVRVSEILTSTPQPYDPNEMAGVLFPSQVICKLLRGALLR